MVINSAPERRKKAPQTAVEVWCDPAVDPRVPAALVNVLCEAAVKMLQAVGIREYRLSIALLSGEAMRRLNRTYMRHDYVTDVVTFDLGSGENDRGINGEICICPSAARRNARHYGESFERELLRYLAHGILHLTGWSDKTERLRSAMRKREDELLRVV